MDPHQTEEMQKLRTENAARLERIEELRQKLSSTSTRTTSTEQQQRPIEDYLQIELDLLPRSAVAVEADELLTNLKQGNVPFKSNLLVQDEIEESLDQLRETNQEVQNELGYQRQRLQRITGVRDELRELKQSLVAMSHDDHQRQDDKDPSALIESLRSDLTYVAECIEKSLSLETTNERDDDEEYWSLSQLLLKLVSCADKEPDEQYFLTNVMDPRHVALLKSYGLVEFFDKDETLIKLVD